MLILLAALVGMSSEMRASALYCFDSTSTSSPGAVVNCSENELCYSEFYSLASSSKPKRPTEWRVDRFCVHEEQCLRRGISAGQCLNVSRLDPVVRRTFTRKLIAKHSASAPKLLTQTEFCCCARDFCNRLDADELRHRFNLSLANSTPRRSGLGLDHRLFMICFLLVSATLK